MISAESAASSLSAERAWKGYEATVLQGRRLAGPRLETIVAVVVVVVVGWLADREMSAHPGESS